MPHRSFLDAASGQPLLPAAREAWLSAVADGWADPGRLAAESRRSAVLLDAAREAVAAVVGARADEVEFAPSGTVAAHLAVLGTAGGRARQGDRVVASAVEHSSVLQAARHWAQGGGRAQTVEVDAAGTLRLDRWADAIGSGQVATACLMTANHEVGTVQPVAAAAEACERAGVPLVVDAAQSLGRVPVDVAALGASVLVGSAHKWGGPVGVGLLVVRRGTRWRSALPADERSTGRVPGPPDVPGAVAAAVALQARAATMAADGSRLHELTKRVRREVPRLVPDVEVVGSADHRLPHLVTFSCLYVPGEALSTALDAAGFAVSSGSSCTASALTPSHVLAAMGVLTEGNIRVSLLPEVREEEVSALLEVLPGVVARLRDEAGASGL